MRSVLVFALLLLSPLAASAGWQSLQQEARGQTVWFNAWGGDPAVNRYLDWVSGEVKRDYAIDLRIVHIADAADAVKRIQTEARAGRSKGGSIDLLWVNGENFRTLKNGRLLQTRWAETLPNWRFVDTQKPVREDFSIPTDGAESPWGGAQLTFIARRSQTPDGPTSPQALLAFAAAHPGSVTYPRPPDFTGTAFLEQLLLTLTPRPDALRQPPEEATFAAVTAPLWHYLDRLHPLLWRRAATSRLRPPAWMPCLKMGPSGCPSPLTRCTRSKSGQRRAAERQLRFRLPRGDAWQRPLCGDPGQCPGDGGGESGREFPALARPSCARPTRRCGGPQRAGSGEINRD